MNNTIRLLAIIPLLAITLSSARASVIYEFDVSDVTWASSTSGDFSNTTFWFEFADGADLNALNDIDLLSMGFDTAVDHTAFSNPSLGMFNINDIFGISGSVASLTIGGSGSAAVWCANSIGCGGNTMQVGQGGSTSLTYAGASSNGVAHNSVTSHTYFTSASAVPIPAAVWLFGSGLLGLVGIARRKKTA